jgi:hypothetical protein
VAELRSKFVEVMVRHQVADKMDTAPPLDHVWSKVVEKVFYQTQKSFESYAESRPKQLFVDYTSGLEKAEEPEALAEALLEMAWWCKANLPQDPTVWHGDFMVYVDEMDHVLKQVLDKRPKLLAPDKATGESVTLEPHKNMVEELNRYKSFQTQKAWWDQLGDWTPVMSEEGDSVAHYELYGEDGTVEYSYEYPFPPEPGTADHDEGGEVGDAEGEYVEGYYDEEGNYVEGYYAEGYAAEGYAEGGGYYDEEGNYIEAEGALAEEGGSAKSKVAAGEGDKGPAKAKGGKAKGKKAK